MSDANSENLKIEAVSHRAIVSLKTTPGAADKVAKRLSLADPLTAKGGEPSSLWSSPGCWLIVSDSGSAESTIERCSRELEGILHLAVDYSAGLSVVSVEGKGARELLASGCGLDFRPNRYPAGTCHRTRFAQIAAFIVAISNDRLELYFDSSYSNYLRGWLTDSANLIALTNAAPTKASTMVPDTRKT